MLLMVVLIRDILLSVHCVLVVVGGCVMVSRCVGRVAVGVFSAAYLAVGAAWADGLPKPHDRFDWTGLYAGVHTGGALGLSDISDPYGASIYGDNVRLPGPLAGGQIGVNYQTGLTVVGLEADASWADLDGTNTCFAFSGFFLSSNCKVHTDAVGTLTARLGWAVGAGGRTLIYGKGGASWQHSTTDATVNGGFGFPATRTSDTRWGWTIGAGLEHAFRLSLVS